MSGIKGQTGARTETRIRQAAREAAGGKEPERTAVSMPDIVVVSSGMNAPWDLGPDIGGLKPMEQFIGF